MYKPPFTITNQMLSLSISITEKLGQINNYQSLKRMPILRRNNKIKSIHSSLAIEANSLSLNQVKDVIEGKVVIGPRKEIQEVKNAYLAYSSLNTFDGYSEEDLLRAHSIMTYLTCDESGKYRNHGEGVFDGDKVIFVAPPENMVPTLMNDLFDWLVANASHLSNVTVENGSYKIYVNSTEYGSCTVSSAKDIKDLYVYTFERTFATMIYKPIEGSNSKDYVPEIDNNYFLNTEPYRTKYIACNQYFLKAMETSYPSYSQTYSQASNNRVQIFFRFHQWCNGQAISAFNKYPTKNLVKYLVGVEATMPTDHITYTIEDEFVLSLPTASIQFLGWYLDRDGNGNPVIKIEKGTTGDIILFAKWEDVIMPDVYSKINYELDGGVNDENNPTEYLEGISTMLYSASKPGYEFIGWSKDKGSNSYISSISELTSGDITLYANFAYAQYSIDYDNFTLISVSRNGKTELIRVTPLEYATPFVALSRGDSGTIGYIEVNVITQEAKLVTYPDGEGLKYMPSALFGKDRF